MASSSHAPEPKTNSSSVSYSLSPSQSITIPQQHHSSSVVKSKMPKLLLKTLDRKNIKPPILTEINNISTDNKKSRGKQRNLIPKKVSSFISVIFGTNKKARDTGGSIDHHPHRGRGEEPPPLATWGRQRPSTDRRKSSVPSKHKVEREKEARSVNLSKNSRVMVSLKKMGRANSTKRKGEGMEGSRRENSANVEDKSCYELCKKKIMMGEKCKPLNVSGSLRYDENGVLVPEIII